MPSVVATGVDSTVTPRTLVAAAAVPKAAATTEVTEAAAAASATNTTKRRVTLPAVTLRLTAEAETARAEAKLSMRALCVLAS